MSFFTKLGINPAEVSIDWDLKPAETFGIFESWGGKVRVRNKNERFYYFYIDNWQPPARLYLMERGIKYARILARIMAPQEKIDRCVAAQGKATTLDASYAIDDDIRNWLEENVVDSSDFSLVVPLDKESEEEMLDTGLPGPSDPVPSLNLKALRSEPKGFKEVEIEGVILATGLFERRYNPAGNTEKYLVDNGDRLTVSDLTTNLMWERSGSDINSIRTIQKRIKEFNEKKFEGFDDWRLPTIDEGLSLLEKVKNEKDLYLHPCFSMAQPFIFTADQRDPGGHWFIDFAQARVFWASGFNPGGFGRVVRSLK
jgi:hypothetical protein